MLEVRHTSLGGSVPPFTLWACSVGVGGLASVSFNCSTSVRPRLLSFVDSRLSAPACMSSQPQRHFRVLSGEPCSEKLGFGPNLRLIAVATIANPLDHKQSIAVAS